MGKSTHIRHRAYVDVGENTEQRLSVPCLDATFKPRTQSSGPGVYVSARNRLSTLVVELYYEK